MNDGRWRHRRDTLSDMTARPPPRDGAEIFRGVCRAHAERGRGPPVRLRHRGAGTTATAGAGSQVAAGGGSVGSPAAAACVRTAPPAPPPHGRRRKGGGGERAVGGRQCLVQPGKCKKKRTRGGETGRSPYLEGSGEDGRIPAHIPPPLPSPTWPYTHDAPHHDAPGVAGAPAHPHRQRSHPPSLPLHLPTPSRCPLPPPRPPLTRAQSGH